MLRKDYIMRMVEQIQRAIAEIVLRRKARDHATVEQMLEHASTEHLGLDLTFLEAQPLGQLLQLFSLEGELDVGKCIVAGELFGESASLFEDRGDTARAEQLRVRGLELYLKGYRVLPENERRIYANKVVDLLGQLPDHPFGNKQLLAIVGVYEAAGRFDTAEDLLFELVEAGAEGALQVGLDLYDRLLLRKDDELSQGGLPREEVEQSRQELVRLQKAGN